MVVCPFLLQRTGEFIVPDDSQSDSDLPVPYSVVVLVQSDRQFLAVPHGLCSALVDGGFVVDLYLVFAI